MQEHRRKTTPSQRLAATLFVYLVMHVMTRKPDKVLGATRPQGPYMLRWYLTPWRGWFESIPEEKRNRWQRAIKALVKHTLPVLYLHKFVGDDDDRALHDHPSAAVSFILAGSYMDWTKFEGHSELRVFGTGDLRVMGPRYTHRIQLFRDARGAALPCFTLFLFFPTVREWGFHCPQGWVHWKKFTAPGTNGTETGRGCE